MDFNTQLNNYIKNAKCTSKELVEASGLSPAVISRYRSGDRIPTVRSSQLNQLSNGLYTIYKNKNIDISKEEIYTTLSKTLNDISINFDQLSKNFNEIISVLNINIAELSRAISFDASLLSKIRTGNKKPSKPQEFINQVCNFIINKYKSEKDKESISLLINCNLNEIQTNEKYLEKLKNWFSTNQTISKNYIQNFLSNLNEFDLNKYISVIHFDELKVPTIPFYKHISKNYYGLEEMKKGELEFFKSTIFSKSTEPIFMCSDMPMEDIAKDKDFGKKWMFAIAMSLKKELHLNIIHNLDRPFNEMMLGLESWIPIYMTGQISPYYLKGYQDSTYCHLNYVSGNVALTGECINNYHSDGKYYLTSNKNEVSYYKTKSKNLLNKASSLMDIYREESQNTFKAFLASDSTTNGKRKRILSSLPIHTLSNKLLKQILKKNKINTENTELLLKFLEEKRTLINTITKENIFTDEISILSKEEFNNQKTRLLLSDCFYEKEILYDYDDYLEHLKLTNEYAQKNSNYILKNTKQIPFNNIQLSIHENKWVMISKNNSPSIHFVIYHPKLRDAIENFIPPFIDEEQENLKTKKE